MGLWEDRHVSPSVIRGSSGGLRPSWKVAGSQTLTLSCGPETGLPAPTRGFVDLSLSQTVCSAPILLGLSWQGEGQGSPDTHFFLP